LYSCERPGDKLSNTIITPLVAILGLTEGMRPESLNNWFSLSYSKLLGEVVDVGRAVTSGEAYSINAYHALTLCSVCLF
jgi:hypothetical protein